MLLITRKKAWLLALFAVLVFAGSGLYRNLNPSRPVDERSALQALAPETIFGDKSGLPPHYRGADGSVAYSSADVTPDIRGYAGPITLLIRLDPSGTIAGLSILDHRETKNFVHQAETPEYLNRFTGKSVRDPFELGKDVDAVSRATVTVQALADTLRESGRIVGRNVLGLQVVPGTPPRPAPWTGPLSYLLLVLGSVGAFYGLRSGRYRNRLGNVRDISLVLGFLVVGVWLATPFSVTGLIGAARGGYPWHPLWWVGVGIVAITFILMGRFYCGWLCPFGALSEFLGRLPRGNWTVPAAWDQRWRGAKYPLLAVMIVLAGLAAHSSEATYETYITLFSRHGHAPAWALTGFVLILNLVVPRFWCRYLCPVAALGGLLSRNDPRYPSRPDCPMRNPSSPEASECIRCGLCYTGKPTAVSDARTIDVDPSPPTSTRGLTFLGWMSILLIGATLGYAPTEPHIRSLMTRMERKTYYDRVISGKGLSQKEARYWEPVKPDDTSGSSKPVSPAIPAPRP